ncbi:MAG TPA: protein translocase subunit SecD [Chthonomonadaceae bacterium]|nr:protein translocase subunit SecD [Chthonomonadaceae bacterium]
MTGKQTRWMWLLIVGLAAFAAVVTFSNRVPGIGDTRARYGLDIQGGVRVVLRAKTEEYKGGKWDAGKLEAVRNILERRVNFTGVSEPAIITKPPDQVVIELPGLKNEREALDQLQSTASLEFYLLPQLGNKNGTRPATWSIREEETKNGRQEVLIDNNTGQPLTPQQLDEYVFSRPPIVTGKDLLPNSRAVINPTTNSPVIEFEFNAEGSAKFEETTRAHIGDYLAIFLDKRLLTAPTINSVIPGKGIIEGNFTLESAKALSDQLNAGALPVPLETVEVRKLEATLGREAVAATTIAGLIGLGLVLLFMLFYYRLPGFLADIALVLYTLFSIAVFKLYPITLTLPGIAGFILSIGMAVDANILIFERLKEELRSGKPLRAAIDAGFKRAFTAIFDSNACTILTCIVLYNFGTGPIRGFALTLGVGVAISMFTAITVTRTFLFTLVGRGWAQNPALYGVNFQVAPHMHVMRRKWLWLGISGAIIIPGLIFWLGLHGIKPSIDFRGGTELQVPFAQRHSADEIKNALVSVSPRYKDSRVVVTNEVNATAKMAYVTTEQLTPDQRDQIVSTLVSKVGPLAPGQNVGYANVSGVISKELTWNAIYAVIAASVLIVLYLAFRFAIGGFVEGLKYGTCAVIALLHDVLVVWGAFAILGYFLNWQIDSLFVTAMLTVIGFSVHDTIIIFDRIRENLAHRQRGESFSDLADRSIDQTIARSINTSFTVVLTLLALFFFGGSVIHLFVAALLIGIISGTYSSIFNASVLLVMWKQRDAALAAAGAGGRITAAPAERPLVTPKPAAPAAVESSTMEGGMTGAERAVPATPSGPARPSAARRRPPPRRRRM